VIPEVVQANAYEDATRGHCFEPFLIPSQLLAFEVLRRPLDSTQYLSIRYTERLADAGAVTSVGSRGDAYDNALAETINGLFKTELIR
jgi:putative transposase